DPRRHHRRAGAGLHHPAHRLDRRRDALVDVLPTTDLGRLVILVGRVGIAGHRPATPVHRVPAAARVPARLGLEVAPLGRRVGGLGAGGREGQVGRLAAGGGQGDQGGGGERCGDPRDPVDHAVVLAYVVQDAPFLSYVRQAVGGHAVGVRVEPEQRGGEIPVN